MNKEKLIEQYQAQLNEAMAADESATNAARAGRTQEAETLYGKASGLYAQAAGTMMDLSEDCDAQELADIQMSVERLIDISRELKQLAENLRTAGNRSEEEKNRTTCERDDDMPCFAPVGNIPEVTFDDIAGLENAKQLVLDEIIHPLIYSDIYERFRVDNSGGLLLFGPPGSGKTMMARAIANRAQMSFFSIKCSDIVGKYFGEAEKRVRALFEAARSAGNAVVFLDEAEALASRRGSNSTVMNRLVPELLAQMDGFERHEGRLIVIFATNRPYDIDPAFLRPGRLPNHCYISLPSEAVRRAYLEKQLKSRPCEADVDLDGLTKATERFSCADLDNLVRRAALHPINRCIDRRQSASDEIQDVISQADLDAALALLHPSVEQEELKRLEKWMRRIGMKTTDAA